MLIRRPIRHPLQKQKSLNFGHYVRICWLVQAWIWTVGRPLRVSGGSDPWHHSNDWDPNFWFWRRINYYWIGLQVGRCRRGLSWSGLAELGLILPMVRVCRCTYRVGGYVLCTKYYARREYAEAKLTGIPCIPLTAPSIIPATRYVLYMIPYGNTVSYLGSQSINSSSSKNVEIQ